MKLRTTPLKVLEHTIREHVAKHADDDETTTMLAIRIPLAAIFQDEGFARQLTRHPLRHQVYVKVIVDLFGPQFGGPSDTPVTESPAPKRSGPNTCATAKPPQPPVKVNHETPSIV